MAELIDIYDANLHHLGVADRGEVHKQAYWHKTFHLWVVGSVGGGSILFQRRSAYTENFPGLFDVSAAGHLLAGESVDDGIREASEELGVEFQPEDVHFLGYRVEVVDRETGYRDREVQAVHMTLLDLPLSSYRPQVSEVAGLVWLDLQASFRLFSRGTGRETGRGIRFEESTGAWIPFEPSLALGDFVPRLGRYYLAACIMAERLIQGRFPIAI